MSEEFGTIFRLLRSQNPSQVYSGLFLIPKLLDLSLDNLNRLVKEIPWDLLSKNPDLYLEILKKFSKVENTSIFFLKLDKFQHFYKDLPGDFLNLQDKFTLEDYSKIMQKITQILLTVTVNQKMTLFFLLCQILQAQDSVEVSIQSLYLLLQISCLNLDYLLEKDLISTRDTLYSSQTDLDSSIGLLTILVKQLLNLLIRIGEEYTQITEKDLDILLKIREFLKDYFKGIIEKICDFTLSCEERLVNLQSQVLKKEVVFSGRDYLSVVVDLVCFWMDEEGIDIHDLPDFKRIVDIVYG